MKQIKLVAFDIDGTLIARGSHVIPKDAKEAIQQLKEKGIHIVVATGRSSFFIQRDVINTIQPDFYVTVNGHLVVNKNMLPLYKNPISLEETHLMINEARRLGFGIGLKTEHSIDVYNDFENFAPYYLHGNMNLIHILKEMNDSILPTEAPYGSFMIGNEKDIVTLSDKLDDCILTYAYENAYEVFGKKGGKADGLEVVLKAYNLDWNEVMTFGDAHNDVPMLSKAGISIAMGNGHQDALEAASYVTSKVDDGGIARALKHFNII